MPLMGKSIESFPRVGHAYPANAYHTSFRVCFLFTAASLIFYAFSKKDKKSVESREWRVDQTHKDWLFTFFVFISIFLSFFCLEARLSTPYFLSLLFGGEGHLTSVVAEKEDNRREDHHQGVIDRMTFCH